MNPRERTVLDLARQSLETRNPEDYWDEEGFLLCGKCHTRKQYDTAVFGRKRRTGILCECRRSELKEEARERERARLAKKAELLRRQGITDPAYLRATFAQDDRRNARVTTICRRYVREWEKMREENIGLLFYGESGAGKTFMACCIARALLEKPVPVCVTGLPRILERMQSRNLDRTQGMDDLMGYELLVLDDLGAERNTPYVMEQVYYVLDRRLRSGKPTIITTNLSMETLKNAASPEQARIYDRVLRMCPYRCRLARGGPAFSQARGGRRPLS